MNSIRKNPYVPPKGTNLPQKGLNDFNATFKTRTEKIVYSSTLTKAQFHIELEYLDSLKDQNILDWRLKFLDAMHRCNWTEEVAKDYLLALSDLSLHHLFIKEDSLETQLFCLIQKKYPSSMIDNLNVRLSSLRQDSFHDVEDYMEAINGLLLRWAAASNATNEEVRIKRHTVFKQDLSSSTRTFMDLQNITNAELIFNRILETENNLKMWKEDSNPKQTQEYFCIRAIVLQKRIISQ